MSEKEKLLRPFIKSQKFILISLIVVIALAIFLRVWNLETNPKWYGDEMIHTSVAWNLINGELRYSALKYTFFASYLPYPPLPYLIMGGLMRIFGYDIFVTRLWTAFCGVLTTFLLYFIGKELVDKSTGLIASFLFAIYPLAVIYNRWGFTHNQGMMLVTLVFYFALKYKRTKDVKWLYFSSTACALSLVSTYWTIGIAVFLLIFTALTDRRMILRVGLISFSLIFLLVLGMFILDKKSLLFDIKSTLAMSGGMVSEKKFLEKIEFLINNYYNFFKMDLFTVGGMVGIFLLKETWKKAALLFVFIVLSIVVFIQRANIPLFFYPALTFLPFVILGFGILLSKTASFIFKISSEVLNFPPKKFYTWATILLILLFIPVVINDFSSVIKGFSTKIDYWAVEKAKDAEEAARFINGITKEEELVLADINVSWLLKCKSADLIEAVLRSGKKSVFAPFGFPPERFVYDCSYEKAKYLVVSNIVRRWMFWQEGCLDLVHNIELEQWYPIKQIGEYIIYVNPKLDDRKFKSIQGNSIATVINNPKVYNYYASQYFKNRDYKSAITEMKKALIILPKNADIHCSLGDIYFAMGEKEEAIQEWSRTIQINQNHRRAKQKLSMMKRD